MNSYEKKALVLKKMEQGDKRSYNELMADLELELWTLRYKDHSYINKVLSNRARK